MQDNILTAAIFKFKMGSASDAQIYNVSELKECVEDGSLGFPDPEPLPNDNREVPYFSSATMPLPYDPT